MKFPILTAQIILRLLHGQVFVMGEGMRKYGYGQMPQRTHTFIFRNI